MTMNQITRFITAVGGRRYLLVLLCGAAATGLQYAGELTSLSSDVIFSWPLPAYGAGGRLNLAARLFIVDGSASVDIGVLAVSYSMGPP